MSYVDAGVRAIRINNIEPTLENVYMNTYPLRATLFIAGLNEPQNEYRTFIAWVQSLEGQAVVARRYAPLSRP
jgi:ABC-type phosphate transport system substrate-binding protein